MMNDGSQYDVIDAPWSADFLFARLEETLANLELATTLEQREQIIIIADSYRHDLLVLHGIDLS
jgi:hypothetical protein